MGYVNRVQFKSLACILVVTSLMPPHLQCYRQLHTRLTPHLQYSSVSPAASYSQSALRAESASPSSDLGVDAEV